MGVGGEVEASMVLPYQQAGISPCRTGRLEGFARLHAVAGYIVSATGLKKRKVCHKRLTFQGPKTLIEHFFADFAVMHRRRLPFGSQAGLAVITLALELEMRRRR